MTMRWIALLVLIAPAAISAVAAVPLNPLFITFGSLSERNAVIFVANR